MTRLVALAALWTMSAVPLAHGEGSTPAAKLTLVWADPDGLLRYGFYGFDSMAGEVVAVFDDAGVAIEWRERLEDVDDRATFVVVHLMPSAWTDFGLGDHAMGAMVPRARPGLNRVVYIFFANVLRTLKLDYEDSRLPAARETMVLARALARVIAHELVHAIAPEAPHTTVGLMKFRLTRNDLREIQDLRLSVESKKAFAAGLRRAAAQEGHDVSESFSHLRRAAPIQRARHKDDREQSRECSPPLERPSQRAADAVTVLRARSMAQPFP